MNTKCIKCGTENTLPGNYCCNCGFNLSATINQNRTLINSYVTGINNISDKQLQTRILEVSKRLDSQVTQTGGFAGFSTNRNQRELIYLVIDVSGSMTDVYQGNKNKLQAAIEAAVALVEEKARIDASDEIGVINFDDMANCILPHCPVNSHKSKIINAIRSLSICGGTDQAEGLSCADEHFDWNRKNVVRRIELLTDGHGGDPVPVAETLKSRGVIIDAIGVGEYPDDVNEAELRQVASTIQGQIRYRFIKDSQTLNKVFTQLAAKTSTY